MYVLGVHFEGERVLIALLQKIKNKIEIVHTETFPHDVKLLDILAPILEGKQVKIVTGLASDEVVRRDVRLKLRGEKKILEALPFQIETLIPFPAEEAIILPFFYPEKEGATHLVMVAAQKKDLQKHLEALPLDPDIVSSVPAALMRFCEFFHPDQNPLAMIDQNRGICIQDGKLLLSQVLDEERLKAYIAQKFPGAFFAPPEEYTIPIGLALDALSKRPMQFRIEEFTPLAEKRREKLFFKSFAAACALLCLGVIGINSLLLGQKEKAITATVDSFWEHRDDSLAERVEKWENSLSSFKKPSPLIPKVSDVLAWASSKKEEIDIIHLHYTANPPRLDLEFKAPSPTVARAFHEELLKGDPLIDPKGEIEWKVMQDLYRTSFQLRKQR